MAKNGYRIFDTDTRVGQSMDVLKAFLSALSANRSAYATFRSVAKRTGQVTYRMGGRAYERRSGRAEAGLDQGGGYMAEFTVRTRVATRIRASTMKSMPAFRT